MTTSMNLMACDCDRRYLPAQIQPHGVMLVFTGHGLDLEFWSANAETLLAANGPNLAERHDEAASGDLTLARDPVALARGMSMEDVLGSAAAHAVRNTLAKTGFLPDPGFLSGVDLPEQPAPFDLYVHRHGGRVIVEIVPASEPESHAQQGLDLIQTFVQRMGSTQSVERIAASATRILNALLGYDRVLVYRFAEDGSATVIAEARRHDMGSLLGRVFPQPRLPDQHRQPGEGAAVRAFSDTGGAGVSLLPPLQAGERPVDLSFAVLRSLRAECSTYLEQVRVISGLSLEIWVEGRLWGVVSCHHPAAKTASPAVLASTALFARYLSLLVEAADRRERQAKLDEAENRLKALVADLRQDAGTAETVPVEKHLAAFAGLIECDGIAYAEDGRWLTHGVTPDARGLDYVLSMSDTPEGIWDRSDLSGHEARLGRSDLGGVMLVPLGFASRQTMIFFRLDGAAQEGEAWADMPGDRISPDRRMPPLLGPEPAIPAERGRARAFTSLDRAVARMIRSGLRDLFADFAQALRDRRAQHDRRRRIIQDELNHRIKNIITLIISIARQTGAHSDSVEDYARSLEGRLQALSTAHDQSISGGASRALSKIVESEAALYRHHRSPGRLTVDGPVIALDDRASGAIALVMHEMMTNAAKYGSLSVPDGRLDVTWHLSEDGSCVIDWREQGGPAVATPSRKGFGTKLISTSMEYDLGGTVDIRFPGTGLEATFIVPMPFVVAEIARAPEPEEIPSTEADLAGLSVLVVEDQALIAMELEDVLTGLGAEVWLAGNVADGLAEVDRATPDLAVLDFNLGPQTSEPVADRLLEQGVPFIFATGYGDRLIIPDRFQDVPVIGKPFELRELARAIHTLLSRPAA